MTRWLVTGAGGTLGRDLVDRLSGEDVTAASHADLDITRLEDVRAAVEGMDVVLNAAAYTDVDGAEEDFRQALAVNRDGPAILARAARRAGARLITVSTDYVFAGDAKDPYREDAPTRPATAYGRSKLWGEQAALEAHPDRTYVVRTAWLYGRHGPNFVRTMLRLERERETVDVVDDQTGQPTWAQDLAAGLVALARSSAPPGVYHASGAGQATWYELARAVFAGVDADPDRVRPTSTDRYPRAARRPAYSVLSHARWRAAGLPPMRPWQDSLTAALPNLRGGRG